jgi:hypothetical protein
MHLFEERYLRDVMHNWPVLVRGKISMILLSRLNFNKRRHYILESLQESKTLLETFQGVTVTLGDANDESAIQKVRWKH